MSLIIIFDVYFKSTNAMKKVILFGLFSIFCILILDGATKSKCDMREYKLSTPIDYLGCELVFDTLSIDAKNMYFFRRGFEMSSMIEYEDIIRTQKMDSLFDYLVMCRFDSITNKDYLPYSVYVYSIVLETNKTDGYIGEFLSDQYYYFFKNYPGYFYQYIEFLNSTSKGNLAREILDYIAYYLYIEEISKEKIEFTIQRDRKYVIKHTKTIKFVEDYLLKMLIILNQ